MIQHCNDCDLYKTRKNIVHGRGDMPADILMIGEAPGRTEDLLGKAFIGRSGKLLDELIRESNLDKYRYYITNTVWCRPCDSKQGLNREPTSKEVLACMSNVFSLMGVIDPSFVILIGKVAETYYGKEFPEAIKIQHPAFILRQGGKASSWYNYNLQKLKEGQREIEKIISPQRV